VSNIGGNTQAKETARKKEAFLELFRKKAGIVTAVCQAVGVGRHTYYDWLKSDKAFAAAIDDLNEQIIDYSESMLMSKIQQGNMTAIIFHLKCKGKARGWVERQELTGPSGGPVTFRVVYEEARAEKENGS
jgi:hypothetical protein